MNAIWKFLVVAAALVAFCISAVAQTKIASYADAKACLEQIEISKGGPHLTEGVHFKEGPYDVSKPGVVSVMTKAEVKTRPEFAGAREAIVKNGCIPGWKY